MKSTFFILLSLFSFYIYGQKSIYHHNAKILDYLKLGTLSQYKITKVIEENPFQISTIYINKSYQIDSILIVNNNTGKLIHRIEFNWSKEVNYLFASDLIPRWGGDHSDSHLVVKGFSFMFKGDRKMYLSYVTQFWIENGKPIIGEGYRINVYSNASRKVLNKLLILKYELNSQLTLTEEFHLRSKEYKFDHKILDLNMKYPSDVLNKYQYGEYGNLVLKERSDNFGGKLIDKYIYDDKRNLIKIEGYANNRITNKEEFQYFEDLITNIKFTFLDDNTSYITKYTYFHLTDEIMVDKD